jgi:outer membrane protein OmpA-like peptidoglycan-associated protein
MKKLEKTRLFRALFVFLFTGFPCLLYPPGAAGEEFFYKYKTGDRYRILSTVKEDVYMDRRLSHRAEILNRIAVEVTGEADGRGRHKALFQTSERSAGNALPGKSFQWAREYESEFERDRLGFITLDQKYFMPVVRNVPVFPGHDVQPGETWSAEAYEMHDFRDSFGISAPYRIPFTAHYSFLGGREWKGKRYSAFSVSYRILRNPPAAEGRIWPRRIQGASDQIVYWDTELGQPAAYEEYFRMIFDLSDGRTVEYRGRAEAEIFESPRMDKEKMAEEINRELGRLGIKDTSVRAVEEGVVISLEDIRFRADTAVMLDGEREKLDKIAGILLRYGDRDIMVSGHTALAGTAAGRMQLSLERASVVADYLVSEEVIAPNRIVVRGFGADRPVADNRTEAGMRKNRRVEITILEN